MDQLVAMRAFVETVKRRSLTNAAQSMGISRALVSRQIQNLEEHLSVRLMNRTTRSISLTEIGEKYFHFCDAILTQIADIDAEISADATAAEGNLAILCPPWIGHSTIAEVVARFAAQHPTITPRLTLGDISPTAYDFLDRGFDVALHTRPIPDSRILARRLADIALVLCAAPHHLASDGIPEAPEDLAARGGLIQNDQPQWRFERAGKVVKITPRPVLSSNTYLALHRAVLTGLAPALLPRLMARDDLETGALVELLPDWQPEPQALFVAFAPGGGTPHKLRLFVDYLDAHFRANPI